MAVEDVLIAGCGTGSHSIETAQRFPNARVLAIDISKTSLAYARRKTKEAGVSNIEYAQADILKLDSIGRTFDLIEAVGVLHHLSDPEAGWRVLLSLLRSRGHMLVGVFSEAGERPVNATRAFITENGYQPTSEDIRAGREQLILRGQAVSSSDFYSVSGCRALWFNAVEHQFTITDIKTLLKADHLRFLGFEVSAEIRDQFERQFPQPGAMADLDCWQTFEEEKPWTFFGMYSFWVQKEPADTGL